MTRTTSLLATTIGLGLATAFFAGSSAAAATTVHVALRDPSDGDTVKGMQLMSMPDHVPAGTVVFNVINQSKTLVHEMLLLKHPASGQLPYDTKSSRIIEDETVKLVDTDDIQPGKSITKTVRLKPGTYDMVCNQPTHFEQGMHTTFIVAR